MQPAKARPPGTVNTPLQLPPYTSPALPESKALDEARNQAPLQTSNLTRGRLPGPPHVSAMAAGPAVSQIMSPRSQSSAATARSPTAPNRAMERRPSVTQAYHHTNKSYGGYQHARNGSFVLSPATSPLSPYIVSADYASITMNYHGTPDLRPKEPPSSTLNGSTPLTPTSAVDREVADGAPTTLTQRRPDRTHNGKLRRAHSHQRSHSRQHHQEQKTVGEYALHHLFTSVCLYRSLPPP